MTVTVLALITSSFVMKLPKESEIRIGHAPYLAKVQAFHHLSLPELELS
jgi:hypothetical protein